jgi:outer membrane biogenesis lipoprotein LolB
MRTKAIALLTGIACAMLVACSGSASSSSSSDGNGGATADNADTNTASAGSLNLSGGTTGTARGARHRRGPGFVRNARGY